VAAAPAAVPALSLAGVSALTTAGVLKLIDGFLERLRFVDARWVRQQATSRGATQEDVLKVIADETDRQAEFERKVRQRVTRDVGRILGGPGTEKEQRAQLVKVLSRERRYARQRSVAQAVRAFAALDRTVLKRESPSGAFWWLGVAKTHTPDCVAMAGKFWPWAALDVFHPPTHAGCRCSLHSYGEAVAAGWMRPGDVQDERAAMAAMRAARALLEEAAAVGLDLRELGLVSGEDFDRAIQRVLGEGDAG
jgi:hypothetical protein